MRYWDPCNTSSAASLIWTVFSLEGLLQATLIWLQWTDFAMDRLIPVHFLGRITDVLVEADMRRALLDLFQVSSRHHFTHSFITFLVD